MFIKKASEIPWSEVTPEWLYLNRRKFLAGALGATAGALGHLKRRDIPTGWVMAALQILHWFNPVVWWGFQRMRADRELAATRWRSPTPGKRR